MSSASESSAVAGSSLANLLPRAESSRPCRCPDVLGNHRCFCQFVVSCMSNASESSAVAGSSLSNLLPRAESSQPCRCPDVIGNHRCFFCQFAVSCMSNASESSAVAGSSVSNLLPRAEINRPCRCPAVLGNHRKRRRITLQSSRPLSHRIAGDRTHQWGHTNDTNMASTSCPCRLGC